ncbi:MAG: glycosyltransferase [Magnetococcus sp. WYHC-3]
MGQGIGQKQERVAHDLPAVSVVIPVKNEATRIQACLEGILRQTHQVMEILVIDSGSRDGTQELAAAFPRTRVIQILPEEFNHGETRNLGVRQARGELILMTVGDARAVDELWLERMLRELADPWVAAVCGLQVVPHDPGTNPVEWFSPATTHPTSRRYSWGSAASFDAEEPATKRQACAWDNVTALYRRVRLVEQPFPRITYGEDIVWAQQALLRGWALVYTPTARVYHFHLESRQTACKKSVVGCCLRYLLLGYRTPGIALFPRLLRTLALLWRKPELALSERWRWWRYNLQLALGLNDGVRAFQQALQQGGGAVTLLLERHGGTPPRPVDKAD